MKLYPALIFLFACDGSNIEEKVEEGPPSEVDWGSWELNTTFISQSTACESMGANGQSMGLLYAEIDVGDPDSIDVSLGIRDLSGVRTSNGFTVESFEEIPVDNTDGNGIGVLLDTIVEDEHSFRGELEYSIISTVGSCLISLDVDAYWLYYEPPPDCGG